MKFDTDPSPQRVAVIAVLLFLEELLDGFILSLQKGQLPTEVEIALTICFGLMKLVTFLSAFMRTGEIPKEVEDHGKEESS